MRKWYAVIYVELGEDEMTREELDYELIKISEQLSNQNPKIHWSLDDIVLSRKRI